MKLAAIVTLGLTLAAAACVPYWMVALGEPPIEIAMAASVTGYAVGVFVAAATARLV